VAACQSTNGEESTIQVMCLYLGGNFVSIR